MYRFFYCFSKNNLLNLVNLKNKNIMEEAEKRLEEIRVLSDLLLKTADDGLIELVIEKLSKLVAEI